MDTTRTLKETSSVNAKTHVGWVNHCSLIQVWLFKGTVLFFSMTKFKDHLCYIHISVKLYSNIKTSINVHTRFMNSVHWYDNLLCNKLKLELCANDVVYIIVNTDLTYCFTVLRLIFDYLKNAKSARTRSYLFVETCFNFVWVNQCLNVWLHPDFQVAVVEMFYFFLLYPVVCSLSVLGKLLYDFVSHFDPLIFFKIVYHSSPPKMSNLLAW